jgi:hypothetical protein
MTTKAAIFAAFFLSAFVLGLFLRAAVLKAKLKFVCRDQAERSDGGSGGDDRFRGR